jgi:hypothetical protein
MSSGARRKRTKQHESPTPTETTIEDLPLEVLYEIFQHSPLYLRDDYVLDNEDTYYIRGVLQLVSRRWQRASLLLRDCTCLWISKYLLRDYIYHDNAEGIDWLFAISEGPYSNGPVTLDLIMLQCGVRTYSRLLDHHNVDFDVDSNLETAAAAGNTPLIEFQLERKPELREEILITSLTGFMQNDTTDGIEWFVRSTEYQERFDIAKYWRWRMYQSLDHWRLFKPAPLAYLLNSTWYKMCLQNLNCFAVVGNLDLVRLAHRKLKIRHPRSIDGYGFERSIHRRNRAVALWLVKKRYYMKSNLALRSVAADAGDTELLEALDQYGRSPRL